jgi:hypothetical protein
MSTRAKVENPISILAEALDVEAKLKDYIGFDIKHEILQILSISLLDKAPVREILTKCDYKDVKELYDKQLKISGF